MRRSESGQVMVLVAVSLLALIGSVALLLLAGSVEWQKNQLQQLADQTALDSALAIGIGCDSTKAGAVITEADNFLGTQRTRIGPVPITGITGSSCTAPYTGTFRPQGGRLAAFDGRGGVVTYLDIGDRFLAADRSISRDVMSDFLHPTAKGYEIWSAAMAPALTRLLSR